MHRKPQPLSQKTFDDLTDRLARMIGNIPIYQMLRKYCKDEANAHILDEYLPLIEEQMRSMLDACVRQYTNPEIYQSQVVTPVSHYPSRYNGANSLDAQIDLLKKYDWGREIDWEINDLQRVFLEKKAFTVECDGCFVVVLDKTMTNEKHWRIDQEYIDQHIAVSKVINMLSKSNVHVSHENCNFHSSYYRRSRASFNGIQKLWHQQGQPTGIILIPAQLGNNHVGESILRARSTMYGNEFPLDVYETLQMLLTHPTRFHDHNDLWIDLPGSTCSPEGNGVFDHAFSIGFKNGTLVFGCELINHADGGYGSASGFFPS